MIEVSAAPRDPVIEVQVHGRLTQAQFEEAAAEIDRLFAERDEIRILKRVDDHEGVGDIDLVRATGFGLSHFGRVRRAALVTDDPMARAGAAAGRLFGVETRAFPSDALAEARDWLRSDAPAAEGPAPDPRPGLAAVRHADGLVEVTVDGPVTEAAMRACMDVLRAAPGPLRIVEVVRDIGPVEFGAVRAEFEAFDRLRDLVRVAVVTDHGWVAGLTRLSGHALPGEIEVFPTDRLEAARAWARDGASTAAAAAG